MNQVALKEAFQKIKDDINELKIELKKLNERIDELNLIEEQKYEKKFKTLEKERTDEMEVAA